jgi:tetratricopeptide (TPR) repeat protein
MDDIHISREMLRATEDGRVPRSVLDEIRDEHLLNRCPHCRTEVEAYEAERRAGTSVLRRVSHIFSGLLERVANSGSREQKQAEHDLRELLSLSLDERTRQIERARSRFRSTRLVRLLLEESRRCAPAQATESFHLADLARRVVNRTPQRAEFFDLYVLATARMANACRVGDDRRKADELFTLARQVMSEHGVTDPEVVAQVDDLVGSLRKDQRRFQEAERLMRRAVMLFGLIGASEEAARVLINLGTTYRARGDMDRAIEATRSALTLLGPKGDLHLLIAGHYNLSLQLVQTDRFEEAAELLEMDEDLYRQVQEPWLQLRLLWLRGDIAAGRGMLDTAERAYAETRDRFVALKGGYDAAMVSLDLAVLYLRQGRTTDVWRMAEEMLPIFEAQDVHREVLAALVLFQEAARQEQLTVEKALEVAAYLREARSEPELRFGWAGGELQ